MSIFIPSSVQCPQALVFSTLSFELLLCFKNKTTILSNSEISLGEWKSQVLRDYMQAIHVYFVAEVSLSGFGFQS